MAANMMSETVWFDKYRYDDAERLYQENLAQQHGGLAVEGSSSLVSEIIRARQFIQNSLSSNEGIGLAVGVGVDTSEICSRMDRLEAENKDLRSLISKLENRVAALEKQSPSKPEAPVSSPAKSAPATTKDDDDDDEDSDIDLFGSDDEDDEEAERIRAERVAQYAAKKAKKPAVVAKSNVIFDVKPWDDETDMKVLEACVRSITMDGLLWGASKLVPVGYGIKKLQISCVIVDDKVSTEDLDEKMTDFEDCIQSVDIAAFNKV